MLPSAEDRSCLQTSSIDSKCPAESWYNLQEVVGMLFMLADHWCAIHVVCQVVNLGDDTCCMSSCQPWR